MKKRTTKLLVSMLLATSVFFTGCSVQTKDPVEADKSQAETSDAGDDTSSKKYEGKSLTILMQSQDGSNEAVKNAMDKAADILGLSLEYSVVPDDQFVNVINTKGSTGNLDDVVFTSASLSDLPYNQFATLEGDWIDQITDGTKSFTLHPEDGSTIMAPFGAESNFGLAYNKAVLEKAGVTLPVVDYASFLEACQKIKASGVTPLYVSAQESWTPQILLLTSFTSTLIEDNLATKLSSNQVKPQDVPSIVEIWNNVHQFSKSDLINSDFLSASHQMGLEAIANGQAGFYAVTDSAYGEIKSAYGDLVDGVGLTISPMWSSADKAFVMANRSTRMLAAAKNGEKLAMAQDFINTCITEEVMTTYYDQSPGAAPYVNIGFEVASSPWNQELKELTSQFPTHGDWCNNLYDGVAIMNKFFGDFELQVQTMFSGKTAEEALTNWYNAYASAAKSQRLEGFQ